MPKGIGYPAGGVKPPKKAKIVKKAAKKGAK